MNIRVNLATTISDGTEVVFRSPVDCSQVTGLVVYYNGGSKEFAFADAHGNNVGDIDHLFAENVVVKVILDVTHAMAFVQNADTNAYIERTFVKSVNGKTPDKNGNVEVEGGGGGSGSGKDGFSPIAIVTQTAYGAVIEITDKDGKTTATVTNGKDGAKGDKGDKGDTGAQGIQGEPGAKGDKGDKGDTGATGPQGETGATGPQGPKGDKGEQGIQGIQGEPGAKGEKGDTGSKGDKGDKGDTGATGATGSRGFSALRITTAPSGYTTATGGFTPTYRVALSTVLSQAQTADVVAGDTVIYSYYTYPVGYVDSSYVYLGARVSIRGATGAAGTTPVKGTDYFTDADKAELVDAVIAALPDTTGVGY